MPVSLEELKSALGYDPSDNTSFIDSSGVDYGRMLEVLHNGDAVRHLSNSILGQFADIAEESIRDFTFIKEQSEKEIERRQKEMQEAKEREKKRLAEEMEKLTREREEITRAMELLAREREADDARILAEQEAAKKKREETARKRAATRAANAAAAAAAAAPAAAAPAAPAPAAPAPSSTPAAPSVEAVAPVATPAAPVVEALPTYTTYQKIDQVVARLTNQKQIDILHRVRLRHPDDQMYFISFEKNMSTDPKKRSLMGTFLVLGTVNKSGERSQYHIDMFNPTLIDAEKKSFYCNCPAHKFQGARDNTVCKHIAFVMCRVVGYMTEEFFKTHRLTKAETDMVVEKVSVRREVLMMHIEANRAKDAAAMLDTKSGSGAASSVAYDPSKWMTRESFKNSTRDMAEEACPICFDDIVDGDGRLNCPECKKHIHKDCIEVWLSRHDSCVYCRSTKWKHYRKCFIENGKVPL